MRLEAEDGTVYETGTWEELAAAQMELTGEEAITPELFEGADEGDVGCAAPDSGRTSCGLLCRPSRARWMRAARAEQRGQKSGQAARAQVRKSWPLRSLERLCGGLAQRGLPAVGRARRARSRCDSPRSPSARSGATVCGVRAVALAPNARADFLLPQRALSTGEEAEIEAEGARTRPASALARAQRPHPPPGPIARA